MTAADDTATAEISIVGANCPWCFNDILEVLRCEPGVLSVVASIAGQCMRVEHLGADIGRLLAVVREGLHADGTCSTEHVMVALDPHVADLRCAHRRNGQDRMFGV